MIGYLDPGAGSMVAGALAAGAAGVGVVARMAWAKVSPRARKRARQEEGVSHDDRAREEAGSEA
ncbi:MAG: hypothetical protein KatS3mg008_1950 [Acidimicrobiales bacterium]|nr:MAG: hypothetical protein KatS3mg008_1950 [Acidimicrobiales bacterium]